MDEKVDEEGARRTRREPGGQGAPVSSTAPSLIEPPATSTRKVGRGRGQEEEGMRKGPAVYSRGPGLIEEENDEEGARRTRRELGGRGPQSPQGPPASSRTRTGRGG